MAALIKHIISCLLHANCGANTHSMKCLYATYKNPTELAFTVFVRLRSSVWAWNTAIHKAKGLQGYCLEHASLCMLDLDPVQKTWETTQSLPPLLPTQAAQDTMARQN